jgi:hypothetical protein
MKKLTGTVDEDETDGPAPARKAYLRSKSTIDLPDPPRGHRGAGHTAAGAGADSDADGEHPAGYRSNSDRMRKVSKVQSAPAQLPRNKAGAVARRGPVDSTGRIITLEGMTRVPNRKLSPLKPLPEQRGRRKATEQETSPVAKYGAARLRNAPLPRQNHARAVAKAAAEEAPSGSDSEREGLSPEGRRMAQMAAQRAYNQQHDPLWVAQQAQQAQHAQQLQVQVDQAAQLAQQQAQQHQLQVQLQMQQLQIQMQQQLHSLSMSFPGGASAGMPIVQVPMDPAQLMFMQQQMFLAQTQAQAQAQALNVPVHASPQHSALMQAPLNMQQQYEQFLATQPPTQSQPAVSSMGAGYHSPTKNGHMGRTGYSDDRFTSDDEAPAPSRSPQRSPRPVQVPAVEESPRRSPEAAPSEQVESRSHGLQGGNGPNSKSRSGDERDASGDDAEDDAASRSISVGASRSGSGSGSDAEGEEDTPRHSPPPRVLDKEEQLVEEMVNMDLATALAKLERFQRGSAASVKAGTEVTGGALGYAKPGATATLAKHAKSLSGHLNAAEKHLSEYRSLADGLL